MNNTQACTEKDEENVKIEDITLGQLKKVVHSIMTKYYGKSGYSHGDLIRKILRKLKCTYSAKASARVRTQLRNWIISNIEIAKFGKEDSKKGILKAQREKKINPDGETNIIQRINIINNINTEDESEKSEKENNVTSKRKKSGEESNVNSKDEKSDKENNVNAEGEKPEILNFDTDTIAPPQVQLCCCTCACRRKTATKVIQIEDDVDVKLIKVEDNDDDDNVKPIRIEDRIDEEKTIKVADDHDVEIIKSIIVKDRVDQLKTIKVESDDRDVEIINIDDDDDDDDMSDINEVINQLSNYYVPPPIVPAVVYILQIQ